MEPLYNVYFGGETLPGEDPASVRERLGRLFKANAATVDKLFNGRMHVVKRDCDRATALRYKQAMEHAGARPVIKPTGESGQPGQAAGAPGDTAKSAAQKIAALASAPDLEGYRSEPAAAAQPEPRPAPLHEEEDVLDLAPPESEVLRPDERAPQVHREVDTGQLEVSPPTDRLAEPAAPPPPAPDVGHLSMGAVGDDIPTLDRGEIPPTPNTDRLSLSPEGTDFSDCRAPDPTGPEVDLSDLDLAPAGSDVLEARYRNKPPAPPPPTDHISLED